MNCLGLDDSYKRLPHTCLAHAVEGNLFSYFTVALVVANVCWIAYESEVSLAGLIGNTHFQEPSWHTWVSHCFAAVFSIELVIRIFALRCHFFFGDNWRWNLFDIVMVLTTFADFGGGIDLRFARVVRIFRMTRVLRIIRIFRFFHDLKTISCAMFSSFGTLFWAMVMIILKLMLFSLFFMQAASAYIASEHDVPQGFAEGFGTLEKSMNSLFWAISGGADWADVMRPLEHMGAWMKYIFVIYIVVMVFGIMNILIGVFSTKALSSTALDRDLVVQNQTQSLTEFLVTVKDIFEEMDKSHTGEISWAQFRDSLKSEELKTFLWAHGLNILNARELFKLIDELDDDPNECIDLDTFTMAMMKLTGQAKCTDVAVLLHETRKQTKMMSNVLRVLQPRKTNSGIQL